jgi:hypothetical protein
MIIIIIITITIMSSSHLTSLPRYPIGYESDSVWLTHTVSNSSDPMFASSSSSFTTTASSYSPFTTAIFHASFNFQPDTASACFTNSSRRRLSSTECLFLHHRVIFPSLSHLMVPG